MRLLVAAKHANGHGDSERSMRTMVDNAAQPAAADEQGAAESGQCIS